MFKSISKLITWQFVILIGILSIYLFGRVFNVKLLSYFYTNYKTVTLLFLTFFELVSFVESFLPCININRQGVLDRHLEYIGHNDTSTKEGSSETNNNKHTNSVQYNLLVQRFNFLALKIDLAKKDKLNPKLNIKSLERSLIENGTKYTNLSKKKHYIKAKYFR